MKDIYSERVLFDQQIEDQLRGRIKNDDSNNPTKKFNSPDSNTPLNNSKELAPSNSSPTANLMHRFPQLVQSTSRAPYQSPYLPQPTLKKSSPVAEDINMSYEGVDLTAEANQASGISWHAPHPIFVIILVGPDETPFGIQKDLLCSQSPYYRQEFAEGRNDKVEYVVKLPDTDDYAFGCFQNFLYTGDVYDKQSCGQLAPDYPILMGVWNLATKLLMPSLRVAVLNAMAERRQQTGFIPSTKLLVEAWVQTEEGSGLRKMLIEWAAEHMRSNPQERKDFIRSLPKEILGALVLVLSDIPAAPANPSFNPRPAILPLVNNPADVDVDQSQRPNKRSRKSANDLVNAAADEVFGVKPAFKRPARKSEPTLPVNRRVSTPALATAANHDNIFTPEKELEYCRDLIKRMVSGPGYWTRYVTNFKKPVDPVADKAPNYTDVVKKPMCLNLMKTKMDNGEYSSGVEFESDIRLIFQNCYEYWTPADPIWKECETFEKFFDNQWAQRRTYSLNKRVNPIKSETFG